MQSLPKVHGMRPAHTALLLSLCLSLASAALLRHGGAATRSLAEDGANATNTTIDEIEEKWDRMDDFVGIMFTLACKWKHGKDVNGLAAERLQNGEIGREEVADFKKEIRAQNLQYVKSACGRIVAKGQGKCRQSCAGRWGAAKAKRAACDAKCVTVYTNFETSCIQKAEDLKMVYDSKAKAASARKQCHKGHCEKFPTVWIKETEADMTAEAEAQCGNQCTAEKITLACERKWLLEVDFLTPAIKSDCFAQGQAQVCYEGGKANASTVYDQCTADGRGTCDSQFTTCTQEGNTDATFKDAQAFCDNRKKMCESQVTEHCQSDHRKALDAARQQCEREDAQALDLCVSTKVGDKQTDMMSGCQTNTTASCPQDCLAKCNVAGLSQCLGNLNTTRDEAELFCSDFWRLLKGSSELDPVTGDPIVLMATKP